MLEYDPDDMLVDTDNLKVGQFLETRGAGHFGKAFIADYQDGVYTLLTDFGNTLTGDAEYIRENFDLENTFLYVVDIEERLRRQLELAQENYDKYRRKGE